MDAIAKLLGGSIIVILLLCISPFLLIYSVNTLAEIAHVSFYIEHGLKSYFAAFLIIVILQGSSSRDNL